MAAVTYGGADFCGGLATRRTGVFSVMIVSQVLGTTLLAVVVLIGASGSPSADTLAYGAAAGVAGAVGVGFFYKGLAIGRMSVVAPSTAVLSAMFPVIYGILGGERPAPVAGAGVIVALLAVALVSSAPAVDEPLTPAASPGTAVAPRSGLGHAAAAGLGFGLFFILLARAGEAGDLWSLAGARAGSLTAMLVGAVLLRQSVKPAPGTVGLIALTGLLDAGANLFYLLASQRGLLAIAAVITSMYPATTVLLARVLLTERLHRTQVLGLACAAFGIVLLASA